MTGVALTQQSYRQVLRHRRLAAFVGGDAVSKVGEGMAFVALPLLALRLHGAVDPALAVSLVTVAPYLLPVAVNVITGLGRGRFDPRTVVLTDSALRSAVFVGLGLLARAGSVRLWSLVAALFAGSVLRLLSASSRRLIATGMLGEESRLAVNGLLGTSDSLALYVVGPALGGLLAAVAGPGLVLLVNGIGYLAPLIAAAVVAPRTRPGGRQETTRHAPTVSGWAILRRTPVAMRLFLVVFLFDLFYGPVEVALPLLVTKALGADGRTLGVLWTSFGLGALGGALLTTYLRRFPAPVVLTAIIGGWATSVGLLGIAPTVSLAAAALAVGGMVYGPFTAVAYAMLQGTLEPQDHQPIITLWAGGIAVSVPLGLGIAGPFVAVTGARGGLLTSAAITALLVPAAARWLIGRPDRRST